MKKMFSAILVLILCFSMLSITAFADDFDTAEESYYYRTTDGGEALVTDPYTVLETGYIVDSTKLIEMFSTGTDSKDEMLSLCNKIFEGEKLSDLIKSTGQLYTVLKNPSGKEDAYAILEKKDLSVLEFGELGGLRRDLQLTSKVKNQISLEVSTASKIEMKYCIIDCFATGTLISDGSDEYFIKTVEGIESSGIIEEGRLYSVTELADIIKTNIDKIFEANEVSEDGNPYTGAGIITEQEKDNAIIFKYVGIAGILLSAICFITAVKIKAKQI